VKRTLIHALQKYFFNPPIKLLFTIGIVPPGYALLETIGRKSGKPRHTPVGNGAVGEEFWIVAEHGMDAGYVRNIAHDPRVRIRFHHGFWTAWRTGTAHLLPEDNPRERQRWLASKKPGSASNASVVRLMGTNLLTVRIDLDPR
jgi:deazaflavin-dependent oxidoreductase (nitroreductase family)